MSPTQVRVGEVLRLQRREVLIDPLEEYCLIGVYSFGKGILHREPKQGSELGDYRFFRILPGDLVLSNIGAWEGGIAYAEEADSGTIGTHRFLTYMAADDRVDTNWARWFFLSERGMELIRQAAPGTVMRNRTLSIERFENLEILLPSIDEQRRIADRLDTLSDANDRIRALSEQAARVAAALSASLCAQPHMTDERRLDDSWRQIELGSVMTAAANRVPVVATERYLNLGIYSFGRGVFKKQDIDGTSTSATSLNRVCAGQFIYSRLFAFEGAYAYVPPAFDGYHVSNEFPTFDPHPDHLDAQWLANYLRSPDRWAELAGSSKGLGVRRQRVPVDAVLAYRAWVPPIEKQRIMVQAIGRLEAAQAARSRTQALARSVVPAALNRAFAGLT